MKKKVKIEKRNSKGLKEQLWVLIAIISMVIYIGWRFIFTIPKHQVYGWLAAICGILLAVSEAISMLEGTDHFLRLRRKNEPEMPIVPKDWYPDIDVFIATHNEETELLYKTINGCKYMDYPDKKKVHIYVCDDGNRPEMAALAKRMKVGYLTMEENKEAKAGNLNHALKHTSSPWIVTFDADMIPTHDFLMETVPYIFLPRMKRLEDGSWAERTEEELDETYKIGFIQTPQSFYNADLFQYNFFSEQRVPNEQDFFFREINVGRNNANAAIYAGSNTLISREALDEAGGIAVGTITEDFETGIRIQSKGYTCYALDKTLAHGLAPTTTESLIKQRIRWGRGCINSLRRVHIILNPHLKLGTKIGYLSCKLYWWTFLRRFIYILSPIIFVLFGIPVVICSLKELLFIWLPSYVLYNQALKITSGKIRNKRWSNTVDTVIFPYMIIPILLETLFIKQKKFHVTQKTREVETQSDLLLAFPHLILLAGNIAALFLAVINALNTGNLGGIILIYWLVVNSMHLIMAVFFMLGRKNYRINDRFAIQIPAEIEYQGKKYYGMTSDMSETGLAVEMEYSAYMPHGQDEMRIRLKSGPYTCCFQARCVHVRKNEGKWKYGIEICEIGEEDKANYFQILYDREHCLAKTMRASTGIFEDIFLNVQKRAAVGKSSKRELPRVEINRDLCTTSGQSVRVLNCNYEYLLVSGDSLPETMEFKLPENGNILRCRYTGKKPGLYQVENWKELVYEDAFAGLFALAQAE